VFKLPSRAANTILFAPEASLKHADRPDRMKRWEKTGLINPICGAWIACVIFGMIVMALDFDSRIFDLLIRPGTISQRNA